MQCLLYLANVHTFLVILTQANSQLFHGLMLVFWHFALQVTIIELTILSGELLLFCIYDIPRKQTPHQDNCRVVNDMRILIINV